ncbi:MAG TPA: serine hydrolase domain-containing protein [Polyangiaceae bacterium]|jgi:CubicO group peptidase (beta-lactamase class C family)|nr:serine hydrolase domain-containing protein [Polyangiaceae bacterium]
MLKAESTAISDLLQQVVIDAGVAPGAAAAVSIRNGGLWWTLCGSSGTLSHISRTRVELGTFFDLASITKSLFAFSFARAVDRGSSSWQDTLGERVPWAKGTWSEHTSFESFLAHRSGLAAHIDLAGPLRAGQPWRQQDALKLAADAANPARKPLEGNTHHAVYSDLGYVLVGQALSETLGRPLCELLLDELAAIGVSELASASELEARAARSVAATERLEWRGGLVQGIVHDDNAFALSGKGISAHAGCFGTVDGVIRFATSMLDEMQGRTAWLTPQSRAILFSPRPGGTERVGFDGKNPERSSLGDKLGPNTFGHYGFTGTGFWCDPDRGLALTLLTNRVCPTRDNLKIRQVRPVVHDRLVELGEALRRTLAPSALPNEGPIRAQSGSDGHPPLGEPHGFAAGSS